MGDSMGGDDECFYSSDQESVDGIENVELLEFLSLPKESPAKVMTEESLLAAQKEDLSRVMELVSLREHNARTLLIHYRWDVERLFSVLVDKGKEYLFANAGVTLVEPPLNGSHLPPFLVISCDVCMEKVSGYRATRMDCGHCFCNDCWTEYITLKINEGQSKRIRCMAHRCTAICDEAVVRTLVSKRDPELAGKFDRFLLRSYIEDNKMVKRCPSTLYCGNVICVEEDEFCEVECLCGFQFCFSCSSEAHSPCSCLMWKLWMKKCEDESETVNRMTVNTNPCPKCKKPVGKNRGCNLVACTCGQYFCWLCGEATREEHTWLTTSGHNCGRYEAKDEETPPEKRDLSRFMHYHNRYRAHTDSLKLESNLGEKVLQRLAAYESKRVFRDPRWFTNAYHRLFRSRRILSYSYPFAFFVFGEELFKNEMTNEEREIKRNLFEDQQQQLAANIEKLSNHLTNPLSRFTSDKAMDVRMQVVNLVVKIDTLCKKMYECIEHDLLGSIQLCIHNIAPYKSKGIEQASEILTSGTAKVDSHGAHQPSNGTTSSPQRASASASASGSSDGSGSGSRKRPREENSGRLSDSQ